MRDKAKDWKLWLETVQYHVKAEGKYTYDELAEHYSFRSAYDGEMGPLEAYTDCVAWLEA